MASTTERGEGIDALDALQAQHRIIGEMLEAWDEASRSLHREDDVDVRWKRGSAAKLLLQHVAVREAAKHSIVRRLRDGGYRDLAARLEGEGQQRRLALARLDELARGRQAIALNTPELDRAVQALETIIRDELVLEDREILPAAARLLGSPGRRGLPSARYVRMQARTHPHPVPRWYEKVGPLRCVLAFYDHLRVAPSGLTSPAVDSGREFTPGPQQ